MSEVALVDVDQVLADTWNFLAKLAAPSLEGKPLKTWGLIEEMEPEERKKAKELMSDYDFWWDLPVLEGAKEGLKLLRQEKFEVVALTAPWVPCKGWAAARYKFLSQHGIRIPPDSVMIGKKKYLVHGALFFDDKAENINQWAEHNPNGTPVLLDYTYNQEPVHQNVVRMHGWADLRNVLKVHYDRKMERRARPRK